MRKKPATEQQTAAVIAAYNAFVELWNRTPQDRRRVLWEGPDVLVLNPYVPWPIDLLDDTTHLRPSRDRKYVRFRMPDGRTFDVRTFGRWQPFAAGDDWQRLPLTAADVRRAWVVDLPQHVR